ncbi:hypothetical protein J8F10_17675 [Gemmata sp. G18]|uniref:DUF4175 family protein n=1 Tax=Gemmata palustris TaxID=2822762 RepID=A0ABS5BTS2_9BACT|nr:hypothetical protein [Gemmata palustris]MBP3957098.1 hypothetical protein [Gemmata palustris]
MVAALPPALEQRLVALVPRVRALRLARGASLCLLAAVAATAFVLLLDTLFELPATARGLFIAVWVTGLGVLVWHLVVRPWQADLSLADVADELAKKLPELSERLRALVDEDQAGTSAAVRAALVEDTARRARAVDFERAIPTHPALLRVCGALLTLLSFLMGAGLVPNSADRIKRVAMPWSRPPGAGVRVVVTSGEPVVRRGGSVTLTAFAEKIDGRVLVRAPEGAVLLFRHHASGSEYRLPMTADETGAVHVTRPEVTGDFEYRVQIGSTTSEWFRVTALDAVELAEGTRIEIAPPDYAASWRKQTVAGFADFDALEYSAVTIQLKFTHPAAAAQLEWRRGEAKPEPIALELAPDGLSATAAVPALGHESGTLRLVLLREENGKKLRSVSTIHARITRDKAPWIEHISGVASYPRTARPDARIAIDFVACDDMNVSGAVLEFDSNTAPLSVPLIPSGTARVTGHLDFDLAKLAPASGTVRFRIRVTDNRSIGAGKALGPQETFYPATGWSELRIAATAPPIEEQDVLHQRDAVRSATETARRAVREAAEVLSAVRTDVIGHTTLAPDHIIRLNTIREKIDRAVEVLNNLARESALTLELRPLAAAAREIADRELKGAEEAVRKIEADENGRESAFASATEHLSGAGDKLDALLARNANLARDRLDRAKLGTLAADQSALARAGEKDVLARQRELFAQLKALVAESAPLRAAAESAKGTEARRLAQSLFELSAQIRDLDKVARQTSIGAQATILERLAHDQEALTKRAAQLFAAIDTAARLAGSAPPKLEEFRRVVDLAALGKTVEALTELERQAQALERIALEFDKWAADRIDPKKGTRQLALWQDDLLTRFNTATKTIPFDKLPEGTRTAFRSEQKALHTGLMQFAFPPDPTVKAARDNAAIHTGTAHSSLAETGAGAGTAMKLAADALNRLAEKTPAVAERLTKTLRALDKLRPTQDVLANDVERALRGYEGQAPTPALVKKLAPLADRQRTLGPAVAALDLPGLGERQARVVSALALAVTDLQDGAPFDIQASQLLVRRELDRLKLALEGSPPPDTKVDELHHKFAALADALDAHGANLTAKLLEPAGPVVQDVSRQLERFVAPEAPALLTDAKKALLGADTWFREGTKPDEARRNVRAAADALGQFRDRLNGSETDLERVQRLASNRRLAGARAKELSDAKAPFNPPASDEAGRQLKHEAEELVHTRVGVVGQLNKRRALDQYARLGAKAEPDRLASDQKALAEALDELAAKMADIAELAAPAGASAPQPPPEIDAHLPSRAFAEALRGLTGQQRTLHDQLTNFAQALADRLRPAPVNPFPDLETEQRAIAATLLALVPEAGDTKTQWKAAVGAADRLRAGDAPGALKSAEDATNQLKQLERTGAGKPWGQRAAALAARQRTVLEAVTKLTGAANAATAQQIARAKELAARAGELARVLELSAKGSDPLDETTNALVEAVTQVARAEKLLLEAARKADASEIREAAKLRADADARVRTAYTRISGAAPASGTSANDLGIALRTAEVAMRTALVNLTAAPPTSAENAMRAAADALGAAAKNVNLSK